MTPVSNEINSLLDALESHGFSAEVNVCSDLKCFERAVNSHPAVAKLIRLGKTSKSTIEQIVERSRRLTSSQIDPRYESPYDAALAAHLLILSACDHIAALLGASIVKKAYQTWWSEKIWRRLLQSDGLNETRNYCSHDTIFFYKDISDPRQKTFSLTNREKDYGLFIPDVTSNDWPIHFAESHIRTDSSSGPCEVLT